MCHDVFDEMPLIRRSIMSEKSALMFVLFRWTVSFPHISKLVSVGHMFETIIGPAPTTEKDMPIEWLFKVFAIRFAIASTPSSFVSCRCSSS